LHFNAEAPSEHARHVNGDTVQEPGSIAGRVVGVSVVDTHYQCSSWRELLRHFIAYVVISWDKVLNGALGIVRERWVGILLCANSRRPKDPEQSQEEYRGACENQSVAFHLIPPFSFFSNML